MIVLKLEGDRGYVPTIICDFCAEPIAGPRDFGQLMSEFVGNAPTSGHVTE